MPEAELVEEFALVRDFAIIMAVAGTAVVIFRRLNQPSILGYLIAGLLVGPFTFPNPPVTNEDAIRLLADLGLVLLLFAVGLEFGWRRIRQVGLGVLLIGAVEIMVMIALGYQVGRLLGWTGLEATFLGAALSISSSAILIKVLRDTGRLNSPAGSLIVGILVVEDFVAVILLTLLSGVATTGAADLGDILALVGKLALFGVASLALGALFVPRIMEFVAQFRSRETMLLTSLGLCFTLALIGQELGLSAAAGAFLIGAVVGDTEESEQVTGIIAPVRDMFGALFFVSIGMLIDVHVIMDYLGPALVISAVFIVGKVAADTVGTFVTGQPDRIPLQVGMGMPQAGEFSLAMVKIGVEHNAIGAFTYQVVAAVTALTSFTYPYIVRSTEAVGDFLAERSPWLLTDYVSGVSMALRTFRSGLSFDSEFAREIRGSATSILVNFMIIVVLVAIGTVGIRVAPEVAGLIEVREGLVGSGVGFATLTLAFPSIVAIWRSLQSLADVATTHLLLRSRSSGRWVPDTLRSLIRDSVMIFIIFIIGLWSIPFVSELLALGSLAVAVPLVILAALVYLGIRSLTRLHGHLVETFSRTFLGDSDGGEAGLPSRPPAAGFEPSRPQAGPGRPSVTDEIPAELRAGVSIGEAEIVALTAVSADTSSYRRRMGGRDIAWDIKEANESRGYYKITLNFRAADSPQSPLGEEEVYVDLGGQVRVRQITRWPPGATRRVPLLALYTLSMLVVATGAAAGVYALT